MYQSINAVLHGSSVTVGGSETDAPITGLLGIQDPLNIVVDIVVESIALGTAITAKLQTAAGESGWIDSKTASLAATQRVLKATFDDKAGTGDGDYLVLTDAEGVDWAVAADTTGSSPEPTGAAWLAIAASHKTQADISGASDEASVAAIFETAFNSLTNFNDQFTTDDTAADGTMLFATIPVGAVDSAIDTHNANDSGAGTIVGEVDSDGSGPGITTLKLTVADSGDDTYLPMRPKARVVVSTGSDDEVVISAVYVSRQT